MRLYPGSIVGAVLGVVALALMMVVSAVSGLNVALPDLAIDTGASQTQVTWIVDAYTLVFVGLLLPAGAVGDRYGRQGILLVGLVVFGAAAALAMLISDPDTLIGLRAVMGVGAAAVMPATLSIITTSFPPEERGRAVGVWVGVAGGGAVIGLFALGHPAGVLRLELVLRAQRDPRRPRPGRHRRWSSRLPGRRRRRAWTRSASVAALVAVVGLVFGIIEGPVRGWGDPLTVVAFVVSALALVVFVAWELRTPQPMLDPRLFRLRGFGTGALALTAQFFGSFGLFFILLQYLQYVAGRSPLGAAASLLPLPVVLIPLARNAPRIADRLGANRVVGLGLALSAAGLLVISRVGVDLAYGQLAAGLVLFGAGMGLAGTPATTAITASLPAEKQGVGSAVNDTSRELGSALGIAVLGTLLTSTYRSGLPDALAGVPAEVGRPRPVVDRLRRRRCRPARPSSVRRARPSSTPPARRSSTPPPPRSRPRRAPCSSPPSWSRSSGPGTVPTCRDGGRSRPAGRPGGTVPADRVVPRRQDRGLVARTRAPCRPGATSWVKSTEASVNPAAVSPSRYSARDSAPAMQPT